jgi:flagellar P-ring protein precursor FlgI
MKALLKTAIIAVALLTTIPPSAEADRLRDIVEVVGARSNQLVGYGIVVGLGGTGDGTKAEFTLQSVSAMLRRLGVRVDPKNIKLKNAAAVMVTAELPPFSRSGQRLDVLVSSLGDARSLKGGTLIQTPLLGADRQVYAVAQGPLSVGGFSASGGGASKTSGHPTVGRIPGGAFIEKNLKAVIDGGNNIQLSLKHPNASTAARAVSAINQTLGGSFASAPDPGMISVRVPAPYKGRSVALLAAISDLDVPRQTSAKIVINERTGTIVVGADVRLKPAAIAHGGLTVEIQQTREVSQPAPFSAGTTAVTGQTEVVAEVAPGDLHLVPNTATVADLVNALNTLGVKPADLIVIFQSLSAAGAVTADIEVQ